MSCESAVGNTGAEGSGADCYVIFTKRPKTGVPHPQFCKVDTHKGVGNELVDEQTPKNRGLVRVGCLIAVSNGQDVSLHATCLLAKVTALS
jgi:hypothetical protein